MRCCRPEVEGLEAMTLLSRGAGGGGVEQQAHPASVSLAGSTVDGTVKQVAPKSDAVEVHLIWASAPLGKVPLALKDSLKTFDQFASGGGTLRLMDTQRGVGTLAITTNPAKTPGSATGSYGFVGANKLNGEMASGTFQGKVDLITTRPLDGTISIILN
jgi:hypothetical protein